MGNEGGNRAARHAAGGLLLHPGLGISDHFSAFFLHFSIENRRKMNFHEESCILGAEFIPFPRRIVHFW